jgi:hypothetical protein
MLLDGALVRQIVQVRTLNLERILCAEFPPAILATLDPTGLTASTSIEARDVISYQKQAMDWEQSKLGGLLSIIDTFIPIGIDARWSGASTGALS